MRWFYIVSACLVISLGPAPFYFIRPMDMSMIQPVRAAPGRSADGGPARDVSVMYDTYEDKIKSLDPATCGDASSASIQAALYETFCAYHYLKRPAKPEDPDVIIPQLAQDLPEISPDRLTCTIRLKKGILYRRNPCFGVQTDPPAAGGQTTFESDAFVKKTPRYKTREMVADDFVPACKRTADYRVTTGLSFACIEDKIVGIGEYRARTRSYPKGDFSRCFKENIRGIPAPDAHAIRDPPVRVAGLLFLCAQRTAEPQNVEPQKSKVRTGNPDSVLLTSAVLLFCGSLFLQGFFVPSAAGHGIREVSGIMNSRFCSPSLSGAIIGPWNCA
jgi:ABC-type transport system substrate-binding protein